MNPVNAGMFSAPIADAITKSMITQKTTPPTSRAGLPSGLTFSTNRPPVFDVNRASNFARRNSLVMTLSRTLAMM
jgi:hypothetical protein